jgi:uncharacterized protein (DUF1697 family)
MIGRLGHPPDDVRRGGGAMRQDVAMPTHVALLRGINVGGHNKVPMAELRQVVASLGHADVATYIQSGNVVFSAAQAGAAGIADTTALAEALEQAIAAAFGVSVRVVVVSRDELEQVMRDNPYPDEPNPKAVHAVFLSAKPGPEVADRVADAHRRAEQKQPGSRDTAQVIGRTIFLHTPDGFGRSELAAQIVQGSRGKSDDLVGTARNWATVTKLLAMCDT